MLETTEGKLKVSGLAPGSGAEAAGIDEEDVILAIDGEQVEDIDDLKALLATRAADEKVLVKVRRDEATVELTVELRPFRRQGR